MRGSARQIKRHGRQALVLLLDQTRGRRVAERLVNPRGKLHMPPKLGVTGFFAVLERCAACGAALVRGAPDRSGAYLQVGLGGISQAVDCDGYIKTLKIISRAGIGP